MQRGTLLVVDVEKSQLSCVTILLCSVRRYSFKVSKKETKPPETRTIRLENMCVCVCVCECVCV